MVAIAGNSFEEILSMIREMAQQIHEISVAIEEVTSGLFFSLTLEEGCLKAWCIL